LKYDIPPVPIPASLPRGEYQLGVKIYWYGDRQPLPVQVNGQPMGDYALLGMVRVSP